MKNNAPNALQEQVISPHTYTAANHTHHIKSKLYIDNKVVMARIIYGKLFASLSSQTSFCMLSSFITMWKYEMTVSH